MQVGRGVYESGEGFRIVECTVRGRARYSLFSPPVQVERFRALVRERYPIGCPVSQRVPLVGCFDSFEAAQAASGTPPPQGGVVRDADG